MNAENEDDFLHHLATNVKTQIWLHGTQLLLLIASMLEAWRFTSTLWWYEKYYILNDTPCSKSQNDFCSFRRVIWLLTQCFKLLSFLHLFPTIAIINYWW